MYKINLSPAQLKGDLARIRSSFEGLPPPLCRKHEGLSLDEICEHLTRRIEMRAIRTVGEILVEFNRLYSIDHEAVEEDGPLETAQIDFNLSAYVAKLLAGNATTRDHIDVVSRLEKAGLALSNMEQEWDDLYGCMSSLCSDLGGRHHYIPGDPYALANEIKRLVDERITIGPLTQGRWEFRVGRKEWICEHGVGHYDPRFVKNTTHGCDGCCGADDFPGVAR